MLRFWRGFEWLETFSLRMIGYFDKIKYVNMASIRHSCDRLPCEIASSVRPFRSCHKLCIYSFGYVRPDNMTHKKISFVPFCFTYNTLMQTNQVYILVTKRPLPLLQCSLGVGASNTALIIDS